MAKYVLVLLLYLGVVLCQLLATPPECKVQDCPNNYDDFDLETDPNCKYWKSTFVPVPRPYNKSIHLKFTVNTPCDLEVFIVKLFFDVPENVCSQMSLAGVVCKRLRKVHSVTFENVKEGNHCLSVMPVHRKCGVHCSCRPLYAFTDLGEKVSTVAYDIGNPDTTPLFGLLEWIAVVGGLLLVLFLGMVGMRFYMSGRGVAVECEEKGTTELGDLETNSGGRSNVKVFILYYRDCEQHVEVVRALAEFLRHTLHFTVIIDLDVEQNVMLRVNPTGWLSGNLKLQCDSSSPDCKKSVVIIVESEGAVLVEKAWLKGKALVHRRADFLHEMFIHGLTLLTTDLDKVLRDCCHLLVVRFPFTPSECRLTVAPGNRYEIPNHIAELYSSCLAKRDCSTAPEPLGPECYLEERYFQLLDAIERMQTFISKHPEYIRGMLTEETPRHPRCTRKVLQKPTTRSVREQPSILSVSRPDNKGFFGCEPTEDVHCSTQAPLDWLIQDVKQTVL